MSTGRISWPLPWARERDTVLDPIIKEARDHHHRRRRRWLVVALAITTAAALSYGGYRWTGGGGVPPGIAGVGVTARGIGSIRFGLSKGEAVREFDARFGSPTAAGINTGCGRRFTEVVWGDFAAEFRSNTFSGYRYVAGGFPLETPSSPRERDQETVTPALRDASGLTLYSTLGRFRSAYGHLRRTGADWWQTPNGLYLMDNAMIDPVKPSAKIVEIKIGTCGDF